MYGVITVN